MKVFEAHDVVDAMWESTSTGAVVLLRVPSASMVQVSQVLTANGQKGSQHLGPYYSYRWGDGLQGGWHLHVVEVG